MRSLVLLPLLLAACAQPQGGPCQLQQAADLPADTSQGRLMITAQVAGEDTAMVLDTGADVSLLANATVAALALPRSARTRTQLSGIGGAVTNADAFADVQLGDADRVRRWPVADVPNIGGLIGGDVLQDYAVELDVPHNRVRLWRQTGRCGPADLPWTGPRATLPVTITLGSRIGVTVLVDGHPVAALLDSGASRSLMRAEVAQSLGVQPAALATDPTTLSRGVDAQLVGVRNHAFASLAVGQAIEAPVRIGVAELAEGAPDMLLGLDWLRHRVIWVDYRDGQLFMQ